MRKNTLGAVLHSFLMSHNSEDINKQEDTKNSFSAVFSLLSNLPEELQCIQEKVYTENNLVLENVKIYKFQDGSYFGITDPELPPLMMIYGDLEILNCH